MYLISFLSNSPRLVAWDLGEDREKGVSLREKGVSLPPWPSLQLWGTKTSVKTPWGILSSSPRAPPPPPGECWNRGLGEGRGSFDIGLGSRWLLVSARALLKFTRTRESCETRAQVKGPGAEPRPACAGMRGGGPARAGIASAPAAPRAQAEPEPVPGLPDNLLWSWKEPAGADLAAAAPLLGWSCHTARLFRSCRHV